MERGGDAEESIVWFFVSDTRHEKTGFLQGF